MIVAKIFVENSLFWGQEETLFQLDDNGRWFLDSIQSENKFPKPLKTLFHDCQSTSIQLEHQRSDQGTIIIIII